VPLLAALALLVGIALSGCCRGPRTGIRPVLALVGGSRSTRAHFIRRGGCRSVTAVPVFTRSANASRRPPTDPVRSAIATPRTPASAYPRSARFVSITERLQTAIGPYVSCGVLRFFALANAGVHLEREIHHMRCDRFAVDVGIVLPDSDRQLVGSTGATAFGDGQAASAPGARFDPAASLPGGAALVRNRFHPRAFHRRSDPHYPVTQTRPASVCWSPPFSAFVHGLGDLRSHARRPAVAVV